MAKDLIIGVVDNYDWDKIKYWANSIEQSGFEGYKALIVYNMDAETAKKLSTKEFMLIGCNQYDDEKGFVYNNIKGSIMVDRFLHVFNFLNMLDDPMGVDHVIVTDVRDVIFQTNPTEWLQTFLLPGYDLLVGSENLTYENEPWGKNNMKNAFGEYFYEMIKDSKIFCAGVIAGKLDTLKDFCINLWLICRGLNPRVEGGGGPDQAAMNIMLSLGVYNYTTLFTDPVDTWVLHAGTSLPAIQAGSGGIGEEYKRNPNMNIDFIDNLEYTTDNDIVNVNGKKVSVLHQWDRVPEWKQLVEKKYAD